MTNTPDASAVWKLNFVDTVCAFEHKASGLYLGEKDGRILLKSEEQLIDINEEDEDITPQLVD